jgi:AraC-like DNA-binding protein
MAITDKKALSFNIAFINNILSEVSLAPSVIDTLLHECRIPKHLLQEPNARVPLIQLAKLTSRLINASGDELLGNGPYPVPLGSLSLLTHWLVTAQTMEQVLERLEQFYHLLGKGPVMYVQDKGEQIQLKLDPSYNANRYMAENMFFMIHRILSWLSREIISIQHIEFNDPKPTYAQDYRAIYYGASTSFNADVASISLPKSLLQKPVRQDYAGLKALLIDPFFELYLLEFKANSWASRVVNNINQKLHAMPTLPELAKLMGVKPYTLQRRLADEGTSYLAIKNHLKRDSAIELLINTEMTIEAISEQLGFSETSPFTRTFKQWTGVPPSAYRKHQKVLVS